LLAASVNTGSFLDVTALKRSYALCIYPSRRKERLTIPPTGAPAKKKKFILKYLINETKDFYQIQFFVNGAPFAASCWPFMMRAHSIRV
jgi:hypothetical protein